MSATLQLEPETLAAPETAPAAWSEWRGRIRRLFRESFPPRPLLTVSQWADRYRQLSKENSADPGQWRTERVPYLREIMDTISNPDVREMVIMKSAQIGATEGIIGNTVGYFIDQEPAPIIVVQPAEGDAEDWSKNKLAPMLRDTPRLRGRVADAKGRDSDNTILGKSFPGGTLKIIGATSPKGLRRTSARIVLCDEVDGYPASAGTEGDPIKLVEKRSLTFWNRLLVLNSTPTIKGASRIEKAFERSDQRRWHVPCPHCGAFQVLRWGGRDATCGIKWEREETSPGVFVDRPDTAYYLCEASGCVIEEHDKTEMVQAGHYVRTNPSSSIPGWHVNALISLFDGARWPNLVAEFLAAKGDPRLLQVFVNTVLGETWEVRNEDIDPTKLEARAEKYIAEVPRDVGVLTAGVDVQKTRLELLVVGWGAGEETWQITHQRIWGDPQRPEVWAELERWLAKPWQHEDGSALRIERCCIDAGYLPDDVYKYVRPREARGVYASIGVEGGEAAAKLLARAVKPDRNRVRRWRIGTYAFKDILFRRLALRRPGPGYMHFATQDEGGADAEFYAQFGAEVLEYLRTGARLLRRYRQIRDRNEAIDLWVLATAALYTMGAAFRRGLPDVVKQVQEAGAGKTLVMRPRRGRRVISRGIE